MGTEEGRAPLEAGHSYTCPRPNPQRLHVSPDRRNHGFMHEAIRRLVELGLRKFPTSLCRVLATSYARLYAMRAVMPAIKARASTILAEFSQAQAEIIGKAVILTDGKAGTVDHIWLDEFHGLRISIRGHEGKWPVSTIKFAQTE